MAVTAVHAYLASTAASLRSLPMSECSQMVRSTGPSSMRRRARLRASSVIWRSSWWTSAARAAAGDKPRVIAGEIVTVCGRWSAASRRTSARTRAASSRRRCAAPTSLPCSIFGTAQLASAPSSAASTSAPPRSLRFGTGGTGTPLGGVQIPSHAPTFSSVPRWEASRRRAISDLGLVLARALGACLGDGLAAATEGAVHLPARVLLGGPHQPQQHPEDVEQEPGGEPRLLAVALAGGEPCADDRGPEPRIGEVERLGAEQRDDGHAPRYAF